MMRPAILTCLRHVQRAGEGWLALCPAHDDRKRSLSVKLAKDGRTLLHCFAGCEVAQICAAANVSLADMAPPGQNQRPQPLARREVCVYDYENESGVVLYQKVRYEPKEFRLRRPDPAKSGAWIWNLGDVRRVLYGLPGLL